MCDGTTILTIAFAILAGSLVGTILAPLVLGAVEAVDLAARVWHSEAQARRERRRVYTGAFMRPGYDWCPLPGTRVWVSPLDGCFVLAQDDAEDEPGGHRIHVVIRNLGAMVLLRPLVPDEPVAA